ncbi:MAG TPA: hypothetical protein VM283_03530, partial [Armatimonadota bacterium]|nr:hypothetical protein [Armatimonadota bacterium]
MKLYARYSVVICSAALAALLVAPVQAAPTVAGATDLVLADNGGKVVAVSSEAVNDEGRPEPKWAATNLIDGLHA